LKDGEGLCSKSRKRSRRSVNARRGKSMRRRKNCAWSKRGNARRRLNVNYRCREKWRKSRRKNA
jgi:hypothetical protein